MIMRISTVDIYCAHECKRIYIFGYIYIKVESADIEENQDVYVFIKTDLREPNICIVV